MSVFPLLPGPHASEPSDGYLDLGKQTPLVIRKTMEKFGDNKTCAAEYFGIFRLHRRLEKMDEM